MRSGTSACLTLSVSSTACAVQPTRARRAFKSGPAASFKSGYKHRGDEVARVAMDGFSLITDHNLLLQSRGMFDGGIDASMFAADGDASVTNYSSQSHTVRAEEEQRNKGKDLFFCDLPDLGGFDDFETNMRNSNPTFEMGSNYFDDTLWSSICSPVAQLVPSRPFDSINVSGVPNQSATATLIESSLSVPDQINTTISTNIQQKTRSHVRDHTASSHEAPVTFSSGEIDQFSQYIDAELFGPFDDNIASMKHTGGYEGLEAIICSNRITQVPTTSSTMLPDESVVTSSTCSEPDLVAADVPCSKRKLSDPLNGTPDMLLEGMAENPLEMYFPPLIPLEQPQVLMSDTSTQTYQFHEEFAGSTSAPNRTGMQFCSKEMTSAELHEQSRSTLILEAVPVKDLGFHRLQNGMNQMDVATKGRIRDALYRLANSVEQRHYIANSSRSTGFRSGRWAETQTNPMDESVAQLLLQKPPHRNSVSSSRVI